MSSWKQSFEALNQEYETTEKKKEALENLLNSGKISQSTYDSFEKRLNETLEDVGRREKALLEKMTSKAGELEERIKALETILANFEIRHVTGEVEEKDYKREVKMLSTGLDVNRKELKNVQEAVEEISETLQIQAPTVKEKTKKDENSSSEEGGAPQKKKKAKEEREKKEDWEEDSIMTE
ncbi:MAG: CdvA-like protein [Thermoproteota archaeon]